MNADTDNRKHLAAIFEIVIKIILIVNYAEVHQVDTSQFMLLNCGLDLIGEVLYGKWKIRLLWFIHQGHLRPSELQRKIPDASRRVLNIQLKELEEHELVTRKIYAQVPPKVEYFLTDFGKTLIPVISALGNWGDQHEDRLRNVILKRMGENA